MEHLNHSHKKLVHCPHCQQGFQTEKNLSKHLQSKHENNKPFRCQTCKQYFITNHELKLHFDAVHLGKKEYNCPKCGKSFSKQSNLTRHFNIVHCYSAKTMLLTKNKAVKDDNKVTADIKKNKTSADKIESSLEEKQLNVRL